MLRRAIESARLDLTSAERSLRDYRDSDSHREVASSQLFGAEAHCPGREPPTPRGSPHGQFSYPGQTLSGVGVRSKDRRYV